MREGDVVKLGLAVLLAGCGHGVCYHNFITDYTDYEVDVGVVMGSGVSLDAGSWDVDVTELDKRVSAIVECVDEVSAALPDEMKPVDRERWGCLNLLWRTSPMRTDCVTIKVVGGVQSVDSADEWMLPVEAPRALCDEKGLDAAKGAKCMWRTLTQDSCTVVIPYETESKMNLWDLVTVHTGCVDPWDEHFPYNHCLHL